MIFAAAGDVRAGVAAEAAGDGVVAVDAPGVGDRRPHVRVPVAALLAYEATERLSPAQQLLAALLGAAIAFAAHGSPPLGDLTGALDFPP